MTSIINLQPTLTGTHITLRPLAAQDFDELITVAERNLRSRRAVEKLGAELAGAQKASRRGQIHVIYRLTPRCGRKGPGYGPEPER